MAEEAEEDEEEEEEEEEVKGERRPALLDCWRGEEEVEPRSGGRGTKCTLEGVCSSREEDIEDEWEGGRREEEAGTGREQGDQTKR